MNRAQEQELVDAMNETHRLRAALEAAERERDYQMGSKLEAQNALYAITKALDLRLDEIGTGWAEGSLVILRRVEAIVDEADRLAAERDALRERAETAENEYTLWQEKHQRESA